MWPGAVGVAGSISAIRRAHYFGVGKIERDQVEDYAAPQGLDAWPRPSAGWRRSSTTIRAAPSIAAAYFFRLRPRHHQNQNTGERAALRCCNYSPAGSPVFWLASSSAS